MQSRGRFTWPSWVWLRSERASGSIGAGDSWSLSGWTSIRSPVRWHYLRFTLLATTFLRIAVPIDTLGGGGRQFLAIIETVVPSVTFVVLLRYYLRGSAIPIDKVLLAGYASVALIVGISSGWLGSFVGLAIMATGVYVYERRKLPLVAIMIGIPIVLFLQPGKENFASSIGVKVPRTATSSDSTFGSIAPGVNGKKLCRVQTRTDQRTLANRTFGRFHYCSRLPT